MSLPPGDPEITPDPAPEDRLCPRCRVEMEPIEIRVEALPLQHLQLCPGCYLVMWHDEHGFQVRQGVPIKKDIPVGSEPAEC